MPRWSAIYMSLAFLLLVASLDQVSARGGRARTVAQKPLVTSLGDARPSSHDAKPASQHIADAHEALRRSVSAFHSSVPNLDAKMPYNPFAPVGSDGAKFRPSRVGEQPHVFRAQPLSMPDVASK